MGYYIFDLDGTLANIEHRRHFVAGGNRDWDSFFEACDKDEPIDDVIALLEDLVNAGHHVEIWSGRSAQVQDKTLAWLDKHINLERKIDSFGVAAYYRYGFELLTNMRPEGDYRPDTELKQIWLDQFHQEHGVMPDMIFDDRQSVVDMWRKNGVTCAQVAPGDFDNPKNRIIEPNRFFLTKSTLLNIMVGPSGAGKTNLINESFKDIDNNIVISSDDIRAQLCGDFKDQTRNADVFYALHELVKTRIRCGLPTIVDATNIRNKDRKQIVDIGNEIRSDIKIAYIVVNRPLEEKIRTGEWRNDVIIGDQTLIERHDEIFNANLKDILNGDGYKNVVVDDWRTIK